MRADREPEVGYFLFHPSNRNRIGVRRKHTTIKLDVLESQIFRVLQGFIHRVATQRIELNAQVEVFGVGAFCPASPVRLVNARQRCTGRRPSHTHKQSPGHLLRSHRIPSQQTRTVVRDTNDSMKASDESIRLVPLSNKCLRKE